MAKLSVRLLLLSDFTGDALNILSHNVTSIDLKMTLSLKTTVHFFIYVW